MARIAVFSKYFGYGVGGAEYSMLALMQSLQTQGHQIIAYVNSRPRHFGATKRALTLPAEWELRPFTLPADFLRFRFFEYRLNKAYLQRLAKDMADVDCLYAYGNLAPAVINAFPGQTVYLARDEFGVGWNRNYYTGLRGLVQSLYHALESPIRQSWRAELRQAARKSRLVANSQFIACELQQLAPGSPLEVIYPRIDIRALARAYDQAAALVTRPRGIVVIGDNVLKGGDIVRRVAARLPYLPFYIFDRQYRSPVQHGNLHFFPWTDAGIVYRHARLVLVPSRCAEAFGRVVVEAQMLGIPVIGSRRGGIPEALQAPQMLVDDIERTEVWVEKIQLALSTSTLSTERRCS